jgi:predicted N-formylglutamate amidohydrolase
VLYDRDDRLARAVLRDLAQEGLAAHEIGDNEPYRGGLPGDTIDALAVARGWRNALIEVRQDLIETREAAEDWGDRLARLLARALVAASARSDGEAGKPCHGCAENKQDRGEA